MAEQTPVTDEIFPQHSGKTYSLVELMPGESPLVGKGPDDTVFAFPIVLLWETLLLLGVTLFIFRLMGWVLSGFSSGTGSIAEMRRPHPTPALCRPQSS